MNDQVKRQDRGVAASHLSRHTDLVAEAKRDSAALHRKMEAHGRAIGLPGERDWSNPKVCAPK
jgi:hypothetical protein